MMNNQNIEGTTVEVIVNVVDETGANVAATINTTTTRLAEYAASVPAVATIGVGQYRLTFSGLSPATTPGDVLACKVNGQIDGGSAWTEYSIPVPIIPMPIRKGVVHRYTNSNSGAGFDDVTAADPP